MRIGLRNISPDFLPYSIAPLLQKNKQTKRAPFITCRRHLRNRPPLPSFRPSATFIPTFTMSLSIAAFLPPAHLALSRPTIVPSSTRPLQFTRCAIDPPSDPVPGSNGRDLSATDREYLSKVRARLFNARRRTDSASKGSVGSSLVEHESLSPSDFPDDLDAMEDILFDRAPANAKQVRLFGGWLDESVAGRKADDPSVKPTSTTSNQDPVQDSSQTELEKRTARADVIFRQAMILFNKGRYPRAAEAFDIATKLVGQGSRLGGQYTLWHAQAQDAAGEKALAANLLSQLSTHMDGDVRKVAAELHFIITAPKLQLDPGSFLEIPTLDESVSPNMQGVLMSNFGPLPTAFVEKPPEPYSLQWYLEKTPPPKNVEDHSLSQALLLSVVIAGTLAYMVASSHV